MSDFDAVKFVREQLGDRIHESGKVFYSPLNTLTQGPIYLMGHNPGGAPDNSPINSIACNLDTMESKKMNDYVGEKWGHHEEGQNKIQRSVRKLFEYLQVDLNAVFTTNLIFLGVVMSGARTTIQMRQYAGICIKNFCALLIPT